MIISKKITRRNNHNAPKLIEKYNDLAREAIKRWQDFIWELYATCRSFYKRFNEESFRREKFSENKSQIDVDISGENPDQSLDKDLTEDSSMEIK